MENINVAGSYEDISAKVSEAILKVNEVVQAVHKCCKEDEEDVLVLEARFMNNMVQQVLDCLLLGGKLILSESYEKRKKGLEKYYEANKLLILIEEQCIATSKELVKRLE